MSNNTNDDEDKFIAEAVTAFEREVGVSGVRYERRSVGPKTFLRFVVGRAAPLYTYALRAIQGSLSPDNIFRGTLGFTYRASETFPNSVEASALLTLLTRSTREVSEDSFEVGYRVPYIPFQKREDHQLAQPASHIVRGRRGVGKSTLIRRAVDLLKNSKSAVAVLDMQAYSTLGGEELIQEVLFDVSIKIARSFSGMGMPDLHDSVEKLELAAADILSGATTISRASIAIKRHLSQLTEKSKSQAYVFLDDFHLIDHELQPLLLHYVHNSLKGAGGWVKVAGLSSLLNTYSAARHHGLQVPGDAQFISLDLTLENPEAAELHLREIVSGFLAAVGHTLSSDVIPEAASRRLVWATAGVPRDFLQMFARSLEHAHRNRHTTVTLSDVNIAIGEFGQQKADDLAGDARNEANILKQFLGKIEELCLDEQKINAFLVRSEESQERKLVHALSDLRMVHLIHQSITPNRAGERYEAYIVDYSMFTGFRRRSGIKEMVPDKAQFKAAELRALPRIGAGFLGGSSSA